MRISLPCFFLAAALVWAQNAPPPAGVLPPGAVPGAAAAAQSGEVPPQTVVATLDGQKITAQELTAFVMALPPNIQQTYHANKKEFVKQYALMKHLASMAEKGRLDQQSPNKQRLEYARTQVMVQAQIDKTTSGFPVPEEDQKRLYEQNRDRYRTVKIKGIHLAFAPAGAPAPAGGAKPMTEEEALAKANEIVKEARGGADFVQLVREHSQDPESKKKDGDFGTVTPTVNVPEPIKLAIFNLKQGEVSEPVRQNSGFYIFRAEETGQRTFDEVRDQIAREIKQAAFQKWIESVRQNVEISFDSEAFFTQSEPKVFVTPAGPGAPQEAQTAAPAAPAAPQPAKPAAPAAPAAPQPAKPAVK